MKSKFIAVMVVVSAAFVLAACGGSAHKGALPLVKPNITIPVGQSGGPCKPDLTCNEGLTCNSLKACVLADGTKGGSCLTGNTCNLGLVCNATINICELAPGSKGGICLTGNTCNSGLACNATTRICELAPGVEGGACLADGKCNEGLNLTCNATTKICEKVIEAGTAGGACLTGDLCKPGLGLVCNKTSKICEVSTAIKEGDEGGACKKDPDTEKLTCNKDSLYCDTSTTICMAKTKCEEVADCGEGQWKCVENLCEVVTEDPYVLAIKKCEDDEPECNSDEELVYGICKCVKDDVNIASKFKGELEKFILDIYDGDGDKKVEFQDVKTVTSLNLSNKKITSINGLEYFIKLQTLNLSADNADPLTHNKIKQVTPLIGLEELKVLQLDGAITSSTAKESLKKLLQYAEFEDKLQQFGLTCNKLKNKDVTELKDFEALTIVDLSNNENLSSVKPLVSNNNFGANDTVDISCTGSIPATEINDLTAAGVVVITISACNCPGDAL